MDQDTFSFVVYIIHACADQWQVSPSKAYQILKDSGCLDNYLIPYADILHTQSTQYVVHDLEKYLSERGVEV